MNVYHAVYFMIPDSDRNLRTRNATLKMNPALFLVTSRQELAVSAQMLGGSASPVDESLESTLSIMLTITYMELSSSRAPQLQIVA